MAPGRLSGRLVSATTTNTSDAPALSSQHGVSSDPPIGNTSIVTATKRKGRGPTRGKALEKMTKSTEKLPVTIDPLKGRSTNAIQSAKLSLKLGIMSCNFLPMVTRWKDVTEHKKMEAFHRLHDRFDINLQEDHACRCCDMILRHRTNDYHFRLHQRFTEALKTKSIEVVRRKPLANMSVEDWNMLIDMWTSPKWQERSKINKVNSAKNKLTHVMGSKTFIVAREEMRNKETKEERDDVDFFKDTHYNKVEDKWLTDESQLKYNEMVQLRSQQTSSETPMTSGQVVETVLGRRLSYIVGQGYGPKPSSSRSMMSADHQENEELREANKELREALSASIAKTAEMKCNMEDMQSQFAEIKQFMMLQSQTSTIVTSSGSRRSSAPQVP